jgi:2-polyprenyl-3-methyl-5-hydroxy-6-metoxy-1,4-benzoquinol methylase
MQSPTSAPERVRTHFRANAQTFDDLYEDERPLVRLLRPGLFRRRELAAATIAGRKDPTVLDVGCGSGRIAEFALQAGAREYLGIDFSEPMVELARRRLARFGPEVTLEVGDFLAFQSDARFDVVLALGLFDYLPDPQRFTRRMFELCAPGGSMVASFPRFSLLKGPIRKVRYEWIGNCPIFNYTHRELELLLGGSGFSELEIDTGRNGHLVRATRAGDDRAAP